MEGPCRWVDLLLTKGADIEAKDSDGQTALTRASVNGTHVVNNHVTHGDTALMYASDMGHTDVVDTIRNFLLNGGDTPNVENATPGRDGFMGPMVATIFCAVAVVQYPQQLGSF